MTKKKDIGLANSESKENDPKTVTKKEIVKTISEEIGLTQAKTKEIVQKTFDAIIDALVSERRIELRNFGVFEVKKRAAREARNPKTGDPVLVPEKYVVSFKPGKEMEFRVKLLEKETRFEESGFLPNAKREMDQGIREADSYQGD